MVGKTAMVWGLAVAFAAMAAGPVSAMEAACLWGHTTPADRTALEEAIAAGPTAVADYEMDRVNGRAWRRACGVTTATQSQAVILLTAFALEESALSGLGAAVPGSAETLRAAWAGWNAADRERIARLGAMLVRRQTPPQADWETIRPLVTRVSQQLGLTGKAQMELLLTFITGRAMRASLEGA
ncbi:MAG: hypothetical protein V4466_03100 [Pseudomonadota bacterium]